MRADLGWRLISMYVCEEAKEMSLPLPSTLRKRSRLARYQPGNAEPQFPKSLEDHFHTPTLNLLQKSFETEKKL